MEKIISLCKRRGFVFPGSEIYDGLAGVYDFGPYGVELLNNLKQEWWKEHVQMRDNYYGIDSGIFKNPKVWDASGHTSGFSDPLAECKECNARIRVDKELEKAGVTADEKLSKRSLTDYLMKTGTRLRVRNAVVRTSHQYGRLIYLLRQTSATSPEKGMLLCICQGKRVRGYT